MTDIGIGGHTNPSKAKNRRSKEFKLFLSVQNLIQPKNNFNLKLFDWMKVSYLKQLLSSKTGLPETHIRVFHKNMEIHKNSDILQDYDFKKTDAITIIPKMKLQNNYNLRAYDIIDETTDDNQEFLKIKWEVEAILSQGIIPKLTDFGTQGTYFFEGYKRAPVAVFKPLDEEQFAPHNPRGYKGKLGTTSLRPGILSGEGCDREVAAYLISRGNHSVPVTTYIEFCHPSFQSHEYILSENEEAIPIKKGSFQLFVKHDDIVGNYGSSLFSVEEVHKIAILDLRILNCDRNEENILVKKRRLKQNASQDFFLIPIDHGLSFPDEFAICQDEVVWFYWDQVKQPFTQKELNLIAEIDPIKDVQLIRSKLKFREICLRNFRIAQTFLKMCARKGLSIYEIAQLMYREDMDEPSKVEQAVQRAEENYEKGLEVPKDRKFYKTKIAKVSLNNQSPIEKKQLNDEKIFNNFGSKLQQIDEEDRDEQPLQFVPQKKSRLDFMEQDTEEEDISPNKLPQEELKLIKRSISQPSLLLVKQISQDNSKKTNNNIAYTEDFYHHVEWQLQILIEQKLKKKKPTNHRDRWKSEDLLQD